MDGYAERTDHVKSGQFIALIEEANKRLPLLDTFKKYNIIFDREKIGWSDSIKCPIHKSGQERTPSFAYNFKTGKFNCFGCGARGGSVEFISFMENKPRIHVAKEILSQTGYSSYDYVILKDDGKNVEELLMKIACEIRQKHKENGKLAERLEWWVDRYLVERMPEGKLNSKDLTIRLERILK